MNVSSIISREAHYHTFLSGYICMLPNITCLLTYLSQKIWECPSFITNYSDQTMHINNNLFIIKFNIEDNCNFWGVKLKLSIHWKMNCGRNLGLEILSKKSIFLELKITTFTPSVPYCITRFTFFNCFSIVYNLITHCTSLSLLE